MARRESVKYRKGLALSAIGTSRARCFYWIMRKLGDIAERNIHLCTLFPATKSVEWTGTPSAYRDKQGDQIQKQYNGCSH